MDPIIRGLFYMACGVTGEVIFTGIKSYLLQKDLRLQGFTQIWVMPIYAVFSILIFEPLHLFIIDWPILIRFCIYALLIFSLEYMFCVIYRFLTGACPWEYKGRWSVHGCINLTHFPAWGSLGLLAEMLHHYFLSLG